MSETAEVQNHLLEFLRSGIFKSQTAISEETDLIAHGFDSLSLVSLLVDIEKTYGLWIPQSEITAVSLKDARSIAAMVVRLLHERRPAS